MIQTPARETLVALEREQHWLRLVHAYVNAEVDRLRTRGNALHVMATAAACQRIRAPR